jgi:hypothetical protein
MPVEVLHQVTGGGIGHLPGAEEHRRCSGVKQASAQTEKVVGPGKAAQARIAGAQGHQATVQPQPEKVWQESVSLLSLSRRDIQAREEGLLQMETAMAGQMNDIKVDTLGSSCLYIHGHFTNNASIYFMK